MIRAWDNDPHGFVPKCVHCDDAGCDRCCPTAPVTLQDLEQIEDDMMDQKKRDYSDVARNCLRETRGALTDDQYCEALSRIDDALSAHREHIEQLNAKLHCMCGDTMDHSPWSGHSPVSMFDHAVEQEVQRRLASADTSHVRGEK